MRARRSAVCPGTDALSLRQIQPLPSFVRKLPIPKLQEILAGDPSIVKYIVDLYMQEDEKSLEGRSSMLVRLRTHSHQSTHLARRLCTKSLARRTQESQLLSLSLLVNLLG